MMNCRNYGRVMDIQLPKSFYINQKVNNMLTWCDYAVVAADAIDANCFSGARSVQTFIYIIAGFEVSSQIITSVTFTSIRSFIVSTGVVTSAIVQPTFIHVFALSVIHWDD